jgi:hypothetical protein
MHQSQLVRHICLVRHWTPSASWCIATFWPRIPVDSAFHAKDPERHRAAQCAAASHFLSQGVAGEQLWVLLIRKNNNLSQHISYLSIPQLIHLNMIPKLNIKLIYMLAGSTVIHHQLTYWATKRYTNSRSCQLTRLTESLLHDYVDLQCLTLVDKYN